MTVQAAIDGIGVAMGGPPMSSRHRQGRLVVPFKITLRRMPALSRLTEAKAIHLSCRHFGQWLKASIHANPKNFLT